MLMTLHPPSVHIPIGLLLVGSFVWLWGERRGRGDWMAAADLMLLIGWWGALVATLTGVISVAVSFDAAEEHLGWINAHALAGLLTVGIYWRVVIGRPKLVGGARRMALWLGVSVLLVGGWLGGRLAHSIPWDRF